MMFYVNEFVLTVMKNSNLAVYWHLPFLLHLNIL